MVPTIKKIKALFKKNIINFLLIIPDIFVNIILLSVSAGKCPLIPIYSKVHNI